MLQRDIPLEVRFVPGADRPPLAAPRGNHRPWRRYATCAWGLNSQGTLRRMTAGDLATAVLALDALVVSIASTALSRRDVRAAAESSRQAEALAERHTRAAEDAARSAQMSAEALEAVVAELKRATPARGATVYPSRPFVMEARRGQTFGLINQSGDLIHDVTVDTDHPEALTRNLPDGIDMTDGEVAVFLMAGAMGAPLPGSVRVKWDTNPQGTIVALPPK